MQAEPGFRLQASGFRLQASGFGLQASGFGLWALGFGLWALGFGLWALGFGLWALGFGLWALGFGLWGSEVLIGGSGFGVRDNIRGIREPSGTAEPWHSIARRVNAWNCPATCPMNRGAMALASPRQITRNATPMSSLRDSGAPSNDQCQPIVNHRNTLSRGYRLNPERRSRGITPPLLFSDLLDRWPGRGGRGGGEWERRVR
jgi:hypothetical protein